ncbi:MAG: pectic acid lyase, partial [Armatimonadetes bacterium]|nr:pectic acid lyase [Armatimonadota bacterium]
ASHGGYVYHYTPDLQVRWGEGLASPDQIWVQPPGTPTVGLAFLEAHRATGDRFYLDAGRDAALALAYGQLESGAWSNAVDFDPKGSKVSQYRNGKGRGRNQSSLDDGTSQAAIRLMIHADRALEFKNPQVHESATVALEALLKAQFPNGAFPQGWTKPVAPQKPVKASYPAYDWKTEGRVDNYWDHYTLNDQLAGYVADTLQDAAEIYGDDRYRKALVRLGDFLLLAQMPEPQPAWAQQYSYAMHPIWARRFEPAAVTGSESQDALETLLRVYRLTKDAKYLEPFPRALEYLKRSRLPDGRLARYYELKSNRPLYMNRTGRDYFLTYNDKDLPDHYGWKIDSRIEAIEKEYQEVKAGRTVAKKPSPAELERDVRKILAELDDQGRWMSTYQGERIVGQPKFKPGDRYLSSQVFSRNVETLSAYLADGSKKGEKE